VLTALLNTATGGAAAAATTTTMPRLQRLTLVFGFELPVPGSGPGGHGAGAEVRVLPGLRGQLQAHGGDVPLADGNHVPGDTHKLMVRSVAQHGDRLMTRQGSPAAILETGKT